MRQLHIDWQALRDTAGVISLLNLAKQQQLPLDAVLSGTHIDIDAMELPFATVRCWQEMTLIRNLQRQLGTRASLALATIPYFDVNALGLLGQGMQACANVEQAFLFSGSYQNFGLSFSQVRAAKQHGVMTISVDEQAVPNDCKAFCVERGIAAPTQWMRSLAGQHFVPASIELRMPAPSYADNLRDFFGVEINYQCHHNRVVFESDVAVAAIMGANQKTLLICQHYCNEMRQQQLHTAALDVKIRELLLHHGFNLSAVEIAQHLQLSPRSLRRRLGAMGTSLRQCVFETRMAHAQLLLNQGAGIEHAANQVGYTETASFSRAFKRFSGQSPGRFAKTNMA